MNSRITKFGGAVLLDIQSNECALPSYNGACLSKTDTASQYIRDFLKQYGHFKEIVMSTPDIIKATEEFLGVNSESEIWESKKFRDFVGSDYADKILKKKYKPPGPAASTALLDNINIDSNLEQWRDNSAQLFKKKFFCIPFQMIDFMKVGSELSSLDLGEVIKNGHDCFGVVLNTDISSGKGKHWFCLYADFSKEGTKDNPYTLEYFNSSGNPPLDAVIIWMEEACHNLLKYYKKYCDIVRSAPRRLQHSQTECGMWSLLYIRSRLENKPPTFFYTCKATDEDMIRYRGLLFRPS
jgi:hypothetical protein